MRFDASLELLKIHLPYHESDHVLTLAYSVLCGTRLEDVDPPPASCSRNRASPPSPTRSPPSPLLLDQIQAMLGPAPG